jgi:hypothetical protein
MTRAEYMNHKDRGATSAKLDPDVAVSYLQAPLLVKAEIALTRDFVRTRFDAARVIVTAGKMQNSKWTVKTLKLTEKAPAGYVTVANDAGFRAFLHQVQRCRSLGAKFGGEFARPGPIMASRALAPRRPQGGTGKQQDTMATARSLRPVMSVAIRRRVPDERRDSAACPR